ncbi:MAG: single-stranded-DNA-specific exonuclease RecJ [Alphaproteobacteria bacterium]
MTAAVPPTVATESFLGIHRSVSGKRWLARADESRNGLMLAQRLALPEIVGRVMAARGVSMEGADAFLEPRLRAQLPDPRGLSGMDEAVSRLVHAVLDGEQIAVFGDYDVDGATSAALLARCFAGVGAPLRIYIPDRIKEGYGPNTPALLRLRAEGVKVVVTVDCGIAAYEPLAAAAEAGLDVIVVDHHTAEPRLPRATAVVNPNRLDDQSGLGQLAAVGVAFLLAVALNRALREAGWYRTRSEPNLLALLDLVALGTVCDVVPLVGLNRALVAQGLKVMAKRGNAGLAALADVTGVSERPNTYHVGFVLGPRVNAGGRVGESGLGARLLTTRDAAEAAELARRLDAYNQERRDIEAAVLDEAITDVEARKDGGPIVFAVGEAWHPGVIGIVASRLRERYNRPAIVVAIDGEVGKGSGRSVDGIDLGSAVIAARQAGLLIDGGGHRMAAGLTVAREQVGALRDFLDERVGAALEPGQLVPTLRLDGALTPAAAGPELVSALERLAPYGVGNPEPRFAITEARVVQADIVGGEHVRAVLTGGAGGRLRAIAFRCAGEPLGQALLATRGLPLHVAGKLRADHWRGEARVQLVVEDAARVPLGRGA